MKRINFLKECDYRSGYMNAISDVKEWFERHSESVRYYRMYNKKGIEKILSVMMDNSEKIMELGEFYDLTIPKEEGNK